MEEEMQTFLKRLDQLRGRQPITRFAEECGIKTTTMRNYLEGNTPPTLPALILIARAKDKTIGWLAGDPDPETPQGTGHQAKGVTGVIQAGGSVSVGGTKTITGGSNLTALEEQLIERLRQIGSPVMINKFLQQMQDFEDYVLGN